MTSVLIENPVLNSPFREPGRRATHLASVLAALGVS